MKMKLSTLTFLMKVMLNLSFYNSAKDLRSSNALVIPRLLAYSVRCPILSGIPGIGLFIKGTGIPAEHVLSTGYRQSSDACYSILY